MKIQEHIKNMRTDLKQSCLSNSWKKISRRGWWLTMWGNWSGPFTPCPSRDQSTKSFHGGQWRVVCLDSLRWWEARSQVKWDSYSLPPEPLETWMLHHRRHARVPLSSFPAVLCLALSSPLMLTWGFPSLPRHQVWSQLVVNIPLSPSHTQFSEKLAAGLGHGRPLQFPSSLTRRPL